MFLVKKKRLYEIKSSQFQAVFIEHYSVNDNGAKLKI